MMESIMEELVGGGDINFPDSDWNRTRSKALGNPHLTRHCFVSEDANWVQQSMSFVFGCQHFSEALPNTGERNSLTGLYSSVDIIITVSSWKGRINCHFEKNKNVTAVKFSNVRPNIDRYRCEGNWQRGAPLACIKKKKLCQSEQDNEIFFSVTIWALLIFS